MPDEIESRSLRRRIALMVMAAAFLVWQVPMMDFLDEIAGEDLRATELVSIVGFLVWAGALVILLYTGRMASRTTDPSVAAALEDELVRSNRSRAFMVGYFVTLATSAVVFASSLFLPITGSDAAHLILVAAVVVPIYAFVVLERKNA